MDEMSVGYFWQAGGFGMYQVSAFGLSVLWAAGRFALQPDERQIPFMRALSVATLWSIAMAVVTDLSAVCWNVPKLSQQLSDWPRLLLVGTFESLTPAALGFGLLSLAWLAHAIGLRRSARGVA